MALILGIDPGSRKCGYGLVNAVGNDLQYVACGVIRVETLPFPERLQVIFTNLCDIIEEFSPQVAAVEEVFVGKSMSGTGKRHKHQAALRLGLRAEPASQRDDAGGARCVVVGAGVGRTDLLRRERKLLPDAEMVVVRAYNDVLGGAAGNVSDDVVNTA